MEESKDCNKDDPSGWSFAKGQRIRMIICKWSTPPDDHLQEACPFRWSFARGLSLRMIVSRGRPLQMIICKRPAPPVHHLQEAGPFGWYFDPFRKLEHRKKRDLQFRSSENVFVWNQIPKNVNQTLEWRKRRLFMLKQILKLTSFVHRQTVFG